MDLRHFPQELLIEILQLLDAADIEAFSLTCKQWSRFVKDFHKTLFKFAPFVSPLRLFHDLFLFLQIQLDVSIE